MTSGQHPLTPTLPPAEPETEPVHLFLVLEPGRRPGSRRPYLLGPR
ncbi:hypothetical protein PV396_10050 [Streptomyces sp. ME02-8801-2C]|nr:hypothetical protein [Streptomyces sp. ME02-8801-2C]MDX3452279.1 hypothetical protein [Streptomyces sp. ME02-8801-2C]